MSPGTATHQITPHCSAATRARGRAYHQAGRVAIHAVDDGQVDGTVRGTFPYEVSLAADETGFDCYCECPAFERGICKHVFALALEVDAQGLLDPARAALAAPAAGAEGVPPAWRRVVAEVLQRTQVAEAARSRGAAEARWDVEVSRVPSVAAAYGWEVAREPEYELALFRTPIRADGTPGVRRGAHWARAGQYSTMPAAMEDAVARVAALGHTPWRRPGGRGRMTVDASDLTEVFALQAVGVTVRVVQGGERSPPIAWDPHGWRPGVLVSRATEAEEGLVIRARALRDGEALAFDEPARLQGPAHLVVAGDRAITLRLDASDAWTPVLIEQGALHVPPDAAAEVLDLLTRTPGPADLAFEGFETRREAPDALLTLRFPEAADIRAQASFLYGGRHVLPSDPDLLHIDADGILVQRDRAAEADCEAALVASGATLDPAGDAAYPISLPARGLPEALGTLVDAGWRVEVGGRPVRAGGALQDVAVRSGVDWFEIEGGARFDEAHLPIPRILAAVRAGSRIVELDDGSSAVLPAAWLAQLRDLARLTGEGTRVPRGKALLLDRVLQDVDETFGTSVVVDDELARVRKNIAKLGRVRRRRAPAGFQGELRAYQEEGLGWLDFLVKAGLGGCLADDMGLGKTIQVLAHLLYRKRSRHRQGPFLVVAPRSVIWNWHAEAGRFAPRLRTRVHHGPGRHAALEDLDPVDLLITTYGTLRRDIDALEAIRFDHVVLDEAQAIKNARSQSARAVRRLDAAHRLALSGTPIENRLGELASLFAFLSPGLLGSEEGLHRWIGGTRAAPDPEGLARLQRALRPVVLRRTKEEVLTDLPPKSEQVLRCVLPASHRKTYTRILDHYRSTLLARIERTGLARAKIHVLEALLRLRQAACHPALIDPQHAGMATAKFDVMLPMVTSIVAEGHKALVFSQFTKYLALLRERLDAAGISYAYLDGRTRKREERIAAFQEDPATSLFLISLKAGGTGLNLTAADYVFLLDPWWNPAVEAQAVDRAHRIGQSRSVLVYRLIGAETIEERVLELQERKRALTHSVLGGLADAPLRSLDVADIQTLLT